MEVAVRRLLCRIPNVVLSTPVPVAAEARIAPSKRRGAVRVTLPPGVSLDPNEDHHLIGPDGSRWRIEAFSESEVVAHEV